jgi:alpha-tubulin suppressor-like RCC1 family protein
MNDGNDQTAAPGTAVAIAPSVKVTDANENPVSGVAVTFAVTSGGGSITGPNQTTNPSGLAAVGSWTLGAAPGSNTLSAAAAGLSGSPITFTAIVDSGALVDFTAGGVHTCALTESGTAYCWGWNEFGQLGNGGNASTSVPVAVHGGLRFSSLSAGGAHTCGLTASGVAYCWGSNHQGQLGNGANESSTVPVPVSGELIFSSLTAGGSSNYARVEHTCGLTPNEQAYCWGDNGIGQLGDGTFDDRSVPVLVQGGLTFVELSTGDFRTCGLTADGAAYCWGWGEAGQLGNGSGTETPLPSQ